MSNVKQFPSVFGFQIFQNISFIFLLLFVDYRTVLILLTIVLTYTKIDQNIFIKLVFTRPRDTKIYKCKLKIFSLDFNDPGSDTKQSGSSC